MPKFALYFIPPGNSPFYKKGSELLTVDIRNGKNALPPPDGITSFDPSWVEFSGQYGFHLTIGDALEFSESDLPEIESETLGVMRCIRKDRLPCLTPEKNTPELRGENQDILLLPYAPDKSMVVLHTLVVALVHRFGKKSHYTENSGTQGTVKAVDPADMEKTRRFHSPTALDNYSPHFTLFNPLRSDSPERTLRETASYLGELPTLTVESVCLVVKGDNVDHYSVHREFHF